MWFVGGQDRQEGRAVQKYKKNLKLTGKVHLEKAKNTLIPHVSFNSISRVLKGASKERGFQNFSASTFLHRSPQVIYQSVEQLFRNKTKKKQDFLKVLRGEQLNHLGLIKLF